jgi:hypothetical protein
MLILIGKKTRLWAALALFCGGTTLALAQAPMAETEASAVVESSAGKTEPPADQTTAQKAPVVIVAEGWAGAAAILIQVLREKSDFAEALLRADQVGRACAEMALATFLALAFYGFAMGSPQGAGQGLSSMMKTPIIFLGSLLICFPALCALGLVVDAGLEPGRSLALLLFASTLNAALLASAAPIAWFFGAGSSYHFMKLMHVFIFAACGLYAMSELHQTVALAAGERGLASPATVPLIRVWILVYGFVGMQMAWAMRPFIGAPGLPFEMRRGRGSHLNFYTAVLLSIRSLGSDSAPKASAIQKDNEDDEEEEIAKKERLERLHQAAQAAGPMPKPAPGVPF